MKRLLIIFGIATSLVSCQKETIQPAQYKYDYTYVGKQGHDDSARSKPFFCLPADYVNMSDTFHVILDNPIDSNKSYVAVGTIYVDDTNSKFVASGDLFNDRWYWFVTGYLGYRKILIK